MHRWVWEQVHGPIPKGKMVLHKCDQRLCYRLDHLYLGTAKDNARDLSERGVRPALGKGEAHNQAKLTETQAREILASTEPTYVLCQRYGMSRGAICGIRNRITWAHLS